MKITYRFNEALDDSKMTIKKGVKKNDFTKDRIHPIDTPEMDPSSGWPEEGIDRGPSRLKNDNPSFEGTAWFDSNNFNDEETNKRPLHPEPDYLNPDDEHKGDDHVEIHGVTHPEDKVSHTKNNNTDSDNYDVFGDIDIDQKNAGHLVGISKEKPELDTYTAPTASNNDIYTVKEEYKHIYKENENTMKTTIQEQIDRIKQMIMFEEGMSYNDVKLLTEQEKGEGGEGGGESGGKEGGGESGGKEGGGESGGKESGGEESGGEEKGGGEESGGEKEKGGEESGGEKEKGGEEKKKGEGEKGEEKGFTNTTAFNEGASIIADSKGETVNVNPGLTAPTNIEFKNGEGALVLEGTEPQVSLMGNKETGFGAVLYNIGPLSGMNLLAIPSDKANAYMEAASEMNPGLEFSQVKMLANKSLGTGDFTFLTMQGNIPKDGLYPGVGKEDPLFQDILVGKLGGGKTPPGKGEGSVMDADINLGEGASLGPHLFDKEGTVEDLNITVGKTNYNLKSAGSEKVILDGKDFQYQTVVSGQGTKNAYNLALVNSKDASSFEKGLKDAFAPDIPDISTFKFSTEDESGFVGTFVLFNYGGELPKGFGESAGKGKSSTPTKAPESKKSSAKARGSYSAALGGGRGGFSKGGLKFGTAAKAYNPFGGAETGIYGSDSKDLSKGFRGSVKDMSKAELLKLVSSLEDENEKEELNESRNPRKRVIKLTEADLYKIVDRVLNENKKGKGCAESEGGSGCIQKDGKGWFIYNNKKGGIWRRCTSKKDCEEQLDAYHAND